MKNKLATALATALFLTLVGHLAAQPVVVVGNYLASARPLPVACAKNPIKIAGSPNGTLGFIGTCDDGSQTLFVLLPQTTWQKVGTMSDFDPNGVFMSAGTIYTAAAFGELYVADDAIYMSVISPTDMLNLSGWKVSLPDLAKTKVISRGNLPGWNGSFKWFSGPKPPDSSGRMAIAVWNPLPNPSTLIAGSPDSGSWQALTPPTEYATDGWLVEPTQAVFQFNEAFKSIDLTTGQVSPYLINEPADVSIAACCWWKARGSVFAQRYLTGPPWNSDNPGADWNGELRDFASPQTAQSSNVFSVSSDTNSGIFIKFDYLDVKSGFGALVLGYYVPNQIYQVPFAPGLYTQPKHIIDSGFVIGGKIIADFIPSGAIDDQNGLHMVATTSFNASTDSFVLDMVQPTLTAPTTAIQGQPINVTVSNGYGLQATGVLVNDMPICYNPVTPCFTTSAAGTVTFSYRVPGQWNFKIVFAFPADPTTTLTSDPFTVNVISAPPPTINSFVANPGSVQSGQPATLTWATAYATSVSVSPLCAISGNSCAVSPTQTTTYTLTANGIGGIATATVTVTVTGPQITFVVNGGTFAPRITPNMWATIFGTNLASQTVVCPYPYPQQCGGAQVQIQYSGQTVNALLYYVSPVQINFYVPTDVPVGSGVFVVTAQTKNSNGSLSSSAPVPVDIATFAPVILAVTGQATAGSVITLWAMGLGPVQLGAYGLMWTTTNTVVTINGISVVVEFSGLAPALTGVYQVNVLVPSGIPAGQQSLILTQDGIASLAATVKVTP